MLLIFLKPKTKKGQMIMNNTNEMPMKQMIEAALSKIREVVDVNTVIGEPITAGEVVIIPFSKVSVGFASGGTEFVGKNPREDGKANFAGGNGAGVSMTPLGFICVEKGTARVIELGNPLTYNAPQDPVNRAIDGINGVLDKAPDLIARITDLLGKTVKPVDQEISVDEVVAEEITFDEE